MDRLQSPGHHSGLQDAGGDAAGFWQAFEFGSSRYRRIQKNKAQETRQTNFLKSFSLFFFFQGESEKEMKRVLGMIILRGDNIVSITAEAPPITQVFTS